MLHFSRATSPAAAESRRRGATAGSSTSGWPIDTRARIAETSTTTSTTATPSRARRGYRFPRRGGKISSTGISSTTRSFWSTTRNRPRRKFLWPRARWFKLSTRNPGRSGGGFETTRVAKDTILQTFWSWSDIDVIENFNTLYPLQLMELIQCYFTGHEGLYRAFIV